MDILQIDKRRKYNDAGVTTTPNRRWPELLITVVARSTVRIIAGSGTAAPLRVVLLVVLVLLPPVRKLAAAALPPTAVPAAAVAAAAAAQE